MESVRDFGGTNVNGKKEDIKCKNETWKAKRTWEMC